MEEILKFVRYLSFRMDTAREKQENPIQVDQELCKEHLEYLEGLAKEKYEELKEAMPKLVKVHERPKRYMKKDGTVGAQGQKWDKKCEEFGQPKGCLKFNEYLDANPGSPIQVKEWLYSLGWKPITFDYKRNKDTGEVRAIEQVRKDGLLCPSVQDLIDDNPAVEKLDGLTVINHRVGVLKGFIKNSDESGKIVASSNGFTNTLRLQHNAPFVNIPGVEAKYGTMCRGVIVPEGGRIMVGADVSSLEDTLKQHFIQPYDPKYVEEMNTEGFDPHLSLAIDAGRITQSDYDFYISCEDESLQEFKRIKSVRKPMKTVNYACQYNVGAKTLSRNSGMSLSEAQELIDTYWRKNWAVKKVAQDQYIKTLKDGKMYLKNPINGYYYRLRYERDIFSTLVQGSGDYCFNVWLMNCRKLGLKIHADYHDEWLTSVPIGQEGKVREVAEEAMKKTNQSLKLNVQLKMDVQTGYSYAECH